MVLKRIVGVILIVVVLVVAYLAYTHWKADNSFGNGDVTVVPDSGSSKSGAYSQPNSAVTNNVPAPSSTSNQPPGGAPAPVATGTSTALPATDSQPPDNPDNLRIGSTGGSSRYQWYRQGNLTWRVDTQTGASCVAFATDDEWRKPRVYQNGCGSR